MDVELEGTAAKILFAIAETRGVEVEEVIEKAVTRFIDEQWRRMRPATQPRRA